MAVFALIRDYFIWHYSAAYVDIIYIWRNYFWFVNHLFSVPEVFRSWFEPLKRLQEDRVSIIKDPEAFFSNLTVNMIMRIVGFLLRTAIILIALFLFVFVFCLGLFVLALWTILPILVGHFFISGIRLLLS